MCLGLDGSLGRGCGGHRWILPGGETQCPSKWSYDGKLMSLHVLPMGAPTFWVREPRAVVAQGLQAKEDFQG